MISLRVLMLRLLETVICMSVFSAGGTPVICEPEEMTGLAIQRAIDKVHGDGGGVVRLRAGVYSSTTLYLKSGVELNLPSGCVILGGARPEDYDDIDDSKIGKRPEKTSKAFVVCMDAENVSITGDGMIDGQGPKFYDTSSRQWDRFYAKPSHPRPRMIEFFNCRGVRLQGVTLKDSPGWTCWLRMCENVSVENVSIYADQMMINNDGIHVDGCRHTVIRDCNLRTGDDCIVMRANVDRNGCAEVNEDLLVEDCRLDSACQAIRLGCPSDGTIRRGCFRRLKITGFNGILSAHPTNYLQECSHGGFKMEGIVVKDCDIEVVESPVSFRVDPGITLGAFGNIVFEDVRIRAGAPIQLCGTGDTMIENVVFRRVSGKVASSRPIEMESVRNVVFESCALSSAPGKKSGFAVNTTDCWERMR